jgi:hypothetical protein
MNLMTHLALSNYVLSTLSVILPVPDQLIFRAFYSLSSPTPAVLTMILVSTCCIATKIKAALLTVVQGIVVV